MSTELNLNAEWAVLWKGRKCLIGTVLVAALIGILLSVPAIFKRDYKATASITPPKLDNVANFKSRNAHLGVATPNDLEQVLDALTSDTLTRAIQQHFKLGQHYRIKGNSPASAKALDYAFDEQVSIRVGKNSTIDITVYDLQPDTAAAIANYIVAAADSFFDNMSRRRPALREANHTITLLTARKEVLMDSLAYLRQRYGLFNLRNINDQSAQLAVRGLISREGFRYYDVVVSLEEELNILIHELNGINIFKVELEENLRTYPSLLQAVNPAIVPRYPSRPSRTLFVLGFMLGAFILTALVLLVQDRRKGAPNS